MVDMIWDEFNVEIRKLCSCKFLCFSYFFNDCVVSNFLEFMYGRVEEDFGMLDIL